VVVAHIIFNEEAFSDVITLPPDFMRFRSIYLVSFAKLYTSLLYTDTGHTQKTPKKMY
jgi:hypothetical protein